MLAVDRRQSIIHVLNVFLMSPLNVYPIRETSKYLIAYQPKVYRVHNLVIKISKELVNTPKDVIQIDKGVDINVREDYRLTIKSTDSGTRLNTDNKMKNITMRVISTRYNNLEPVYAILFDFKWRRTAKGGRDELEFNIPECPLITSSSTIDNVCYKRISSQVSGSGTHAIHTYLIISPQRGTYEIGKWIKVSNETFHTYETPVTVSL